jgi:hypothetical protein
MEVKVRGLEAKVQSLQMHIGGDGVQIGGVVFQCFEDVKTWVVTKIITCLYGFADVSGAGFGSTLQLPSGQVAYHYGVWARDAEHFFVQLPKIAQLGGVPRAQSPRW